jgi:acetyl-CoA synthetase (ADP-forming)
MNSEITKIASVARAEGRRNLFEHEALQLCSRYGIPTPPFEVATSREGAATAARRIGYPIAMKVVSPDILHKTEAGGVVLDIRNEPEVKDSFQRISANAKQRNPQCRIIGVIVERMIPKGTEIIVGALRDEQFGPAIMFGVGGVLAELVRDVSFRVIPISRFDAYDLIDDLRFPAILKGFRGGPHADRKTIVDILMKTCRMIVEAPEIESLDLNPVVVNEKSATVADARILLRDPSPNATKRS